MATSNKESKNLRYFRVDGSYVVRARNQAEAIRATQRASVPGTTVLAGDASAERVSRDDALSELSEG